MTPKQRRALLDAIARGSTVTVAAELANVPRRTVYDSLRKPTEDGQEFRREWKRALAQGVERRPLAVRYRKNDE